MSVTKKEKFQVAIADDHTLMRGALANLINSLDNYNIVFEANSGKGIKEKISQHIIPDIVLLDVNMPDMDGYETVSWIHKNYPQIKVLALSMSNEESTIIRMLKLGAKGYIMKNAEPEELKLALDSVIQKNFYLSEFISGKIISGLHNNADKLDEQIILNEKEKEFLQWVCTEMTYKEIAAKMFVSPRTVEDYRNALFEKTKVKTRVGLVLFAIKNNLVDL